MLTEGMFVVDRYEILEQVGAGGMADVYKAKDHILGRIVAVKVLKAEYSEDVNFVTKFRSEAQAAAGMEHQNIVNIYDVGSENGVHFIVMEYIEGITLKTYIEKKGQLSFKEATSIAIQVARGIEAAHNKDIIHRDIKPQNIIISTEGKVKVTDFGIARAVSGNTISADAMGSVHYASPEQARNGFVDGRSDIYSLGIVMYEMVTGRVPFDGETTVAVAIQHLQEEMVEPSAFAPDLPISYEKIVLKTTQKSADRRYQDVTELLADLRKALVTPDEDFVVIAPVLSSKTRVITSEEVDTIRTTAEAMELEKGNGFAPGNTEEDIEDDEDEDATGFLDPKTEKIVTIAGIAVLILIAIIAIYLIGSFIGLFKFDGNQGGGSQQGNNTQISSESESESDDTEKVEMINVVGKHVDVAKDDLNAIGLKMSIIAYDSDSDQPDGTVLDQSEEEGTMVNKDSTILVVVAGENENEEVVKEEVPNVVGATEDDAVNKLQNKGFLVTKEYEFSETVEKGRVISQTPDAGEEEKVGSRITIVISKGPEKDLVMVPDNLVGKDVDYVQGVLNGLGFEVEIRERDDGKEVGTVLEVEGAGTEVEKGSTIVIYVQEVNEPELITVPNDLIGKSMEDAKAALESLGFKVNVVTQSNDAAEGTVFKVDGAGTQKEKGSTITIYVSTGPEEPEDPVDPEEPEDPVDPEEPTGYKEF